MHAVLIMILRRHRLAALAWLTALTLYLSYSVALDAWVNPTLILTALFVGIYVPQYSRISNRIEAYLQSVSATLTLGRLGRFAFQFLFNTCVYALFWAGGVIEGASLRQLGGALGAAVLTTVASQGAQYAGQVAFRYGYGHADWNTLVALCTNTFIAALALAGFSVARDLFLVFATMFGAFVFGAGIVSDLRAVFFPTGGIAVFFGTFNPFHLGHLELVKRALEDRRVEKVVIHPTIIPKLHADALAAGEIRVARIEEGLEVYERTDRADPLKDYFPTGTRFYPPEDRRRMIELAVSDAGLSDRVEVAFMPDIYRNHGFRGVFREIRRQNQGKPIHGIHGSDGGAMLVRTIMDESGWHYPYSIVRRSDISATAIRDGRMGMTTPSVASALRRYGAATQVPPRDFCPSPTLDPFDDDDFGCAVAPV